MDSSLLTRKKPEGSSLEATLVDKSLPSVEDGERRFSVEDFTNILVHAQKEQEIAEIRCNHERERKIIEGLVGNGSLESKRGVLVSEIYKCADELNISREYVEEIIRRRYPSVEEQNLAIKVLGVKPSDDLFFSRNKNYFERLSDEYENSIRNCLSESFPELIVKKKKRPFGTHYVLGKYIIKVDKKLPKELFGIFNPSRTILKLTMEIDYLQGTKGIRFQVYDSKVLCALQDTIKNLNEKFYSQEDKAPVYHNPPEMILLNEPSE